MGWALRAVQDEGILEQRTTALDLLEQLLRLNRAQRFEIAEDLSKDKLALYPLLELWQTYWRDVLLLCQRADHIPANSDRAEAIRQLAGVVGADEALTALQATRTLFNNLPLNLNLRLALEVMLLDYPGLKHGR